MRTELPGGWAEHRAYDSLRGNDRRKLTRFVRRFIPRLPDGTQDPRGLAQDQQDDVEDQIRDAAWAMVLQGWSFELPLPSLVDGELVDAGSFGELPLADYAALEALLQPFYVALTRQADPKEATTSASNGSSPAKARNSRKG